jgi:hypothetical protein
MAWSALLAMETNTIDIISRCVSDKESVIFTWSSGWETLILAYSWAGSRALSNSGRFVCVIAKRGFWWQEFNVEKAYTGGVDIVIVIILATEQHNNGNDGSNDQNDSDDCDQNDCPERKRRAWNGLNSVDEIVVDMCWCVTVCGDIEVLSLLVAVDEPIDDVEVSDDVAGVVVSISVVVASDGEVGLDGTVVDGTVLLDAVGVAVVGFEVVVDIVVDFEVVDLAVVVVEVVVVVVVGFGVVCRMVKWWQCDKCNATSDGTIVEDITDCEEAVVAIGIVLVVVVVVVVMVVVVRVRQPTLCVSLRWHLHVPHASLVYNKVASQKLPAVSKATYEAVLFVAGLMFMCRMNVRIDGKMSKITVLAYYVQNTNKDWTKISRKNYNYIDLTTPSTSLVNLAPNRRLHCDRHDCEDSTWMLSATHTTIITALPIQAASTVAKFRWIDCWPRS